MESTEGIRKTRWPPFWVFLVLYALLLLAITDKRIVPTGAIFSRIALVESIVERGTLAIDDSPFSRTVDRVVVDGHTYSDKLPLQQVAAAGIYGILHHVLGLSFTTHPGTTLYILTLLTVGAASVILVALFHRHLRRPGITIALALGTLVLSYGGTYQNHTICAVLLFGGILALGSAREGSWKSAGLSGLLLGLAASAEMPTGFIFALVSGIALLVRPDRKILGAFVAGFAIPMILQSAILWAAWGDPRPAYLLPGAYDYEGSAFDGRRAGLIQSTRVPGNVVSYAFHNILGYRGIFSTTPVLIMGVIGLISLLRKKDDPQLWKAWVIGSGSMLVIIFYCLATDSYGGWAYGLRFFIPLAAPLLLLAAWAPRWKGLWIPLLALSILFASIGVYHPWTPCYQGETIRNEYADVVRFPPTGNLAAMAEDVLPRSGLAAACRRTFIHPDDEKGYRYLAVFYATQGRR